jgi:hypothetical protein
MLVLRFYSGLSDRVGMVYLFFLCVVSLFSNRFTGSYGALNFLKYFVFHFFITEHCVHLEIFMDLVFFRISIDILQT